MAAKLRLDGKVAIVTGGASGIGEATARLFAAHGAAVIIADVNDSLALSVAATIPGCSFVHCDVRDELQISAVVLRAVETHGRLDVMFSNAGVIGSTTGFLDLDIADLDNVFAVHVRGSAAAIKHAGRAMAAAGTGGSIICTASVAAIVGGLGPPAYTAAKHALVGLVKAAASELGVNGVRVNCVSPFAVPTRMSCGEEFEKMKPEVVEMWASAAASLKGPVLRPLDIAAAVLFLASDESAFVTGHNLVVDGGMTVVSPHCELIAEVAGGRAGHK